MTQQQREALLDLLHIAILTDSHISLQEDEKLLSAIETLGWDSSRPKEIHMLNSIARARRAIDTAEATAEFLTSRGIHFNTQESQNAALTVLESILSSDGISSAESAFIGKLRSIFQQSTGLPN